MELAGLIFGVIGIVLAFYFGGKSRRLKASIKMSRGSREREIFYGERSAIPRVEEHKEKTEVPVSVLDELKSRDTKGHKANARLEKYLAEQICELRGKLEKMESVKVDFAVLKEKYRIKRTVEWIRNFVGICIGITGTLVFSADLSQRGLWVAFTAVLIIVFLITCIYSFSSKERT
jgi:hypothetical protein